MTYFKNVQSLEELKNQFRELARKNHPDAGGDPEAMKAINQEYDQLFPIWKKRHNMTAAEPVNETADSTRAQFYTQNGWKGSKHDWNRSLKEVAAIIRAYVKEMYPTYKFSVRTSYASMCQELHVDLVNAPQEIYKKFEELTQDEVVQVWMKAERNWWVPNTGCLDDEMMEKVKTAYSEHSFLLVMTEVAQAVIDDVNREVNSYNFEDCDGMIDYFHVDFYYFGCGISDKFQVVEKTARIKNKAQATAPATTEANTEAAEENPVVPEIAQEYEIKQDVHTKTNEVIFVVKLLKTLTREEYIKVAEKMRELGGYYSKFKHGFIFKENPEKLLVA